MGQIFSESDNSETLQVIKLSKHGFIPSRQSAEAAGLDLHSARDVTIPAHGHVKIPLDIAIAIPKGYYGQIAARSRLALQHLGIGGGIIDSDYRGNVSVILFNHGNKDYSVKMGDRIAQLVIIKCCSPEVFQTQILEDTARGTGGFGSTGI